MRAPTCPSTSRRRRRRRTRRPVGSSSSGPSGSAGIRRSSSPMSPRSSSCCSRSRSSSADLAERLDASAAEVTDLMDRLVAAGVVEPVVEPTRRGGPRGGPIRGAGGVGGAPRPPAGHPPAPPGRPRHRPPTGGPPPGEGRPPRPAPAGPPTALEEGGRGRPDQASLLPTSGVGVRPAGVLACRVPMGGDCTVRRSCRSPAAPARSSWPTASAKRSTLATNRPRPRRCAAPTASTARSCPTAAGTPAVVLVQPVGVAEVGRRRGTPGSPTPAAG